MTTVAILFFLVGSIIQFIGYAVGQDAFFFVTGCCSLAAALLIALSDS